MTSHGPGHVLFHFVRHWARRPVTADAGGDQGRLVLICAAMADDAKHRSPPAGRSMLGQAHRWQEEVFARLTTGWSARKRQDFQQAMTDLMGRSYAMDA